jgi:hypothetical protein
MTHTELILQTLKMLPPALHVVLTPILRTEAFFGKQKISLQIFYDIHTVHVLNNQYIIQQMHLVI